MKVLVTGANGFLGYYLTHLLLQKGYEVVATGKGECRLPFKEENFIYASMDFTDPFAVHDVFEKMKPAVVIHAGAMSKVDECELNQWECYLANVEGTLAVLLNAAEYRSHFIFVSTDFIFDGEKGMYTEDDIPNPISFYGRTKLEAEEAVKEYEYDWTIARTILVYGKPFTGKENILTVVKRKLEKGESYQMACMTADHLGLDKSLIKKVTVAEFSQPAKRPAKTGFNIEKARKELGFKPLSFQEGLGKTFQ